MVTVFTYVSMALSFLAVLYVTPKWISTAKRLGFTGKDLNKHEDKEVAEAGGLPAVFGFIVGFFFYLGFIVFYYGVNAESVLFSFAAATTFLLAAFIGFADDILGWRVGLDQFYKVLLTLLIPLPIMVLNAGSSLMTIPFLGSIDFGWFFPLVIVPAAIIGTTNGFNMLAGYNGLETGLGIMILSSLGILSFLEGKGYVAAVCAMIVPSLLAFLYYNWYPAEVFPGDTLTYGVGAMIGVVAILANIERFALMLFTPYFFELVLKARGKFKLANWAEADEEGHLENKYGKWYGWTNVMISFWDKVKGSVTEKQVVLSVYAIELVFVALTFFSYFGFLPV